MDDEIQITCLQPLRLVEISIWLPPFSDIYTKAPDYIASSWEHAEWSVRAFSDANLPPTELIVAVFFDHLPDSPPNRSIFQYFTLFLENGEIYTCNRRKVRSLAEALNQNLLRAVANPRATPLVRQLARIMAEFADIPVHAI